MSFRVDKWSLDDFDRRTRVAVNVERATTGQAGSPYGRSLPQHPLYHRPTRCLECVSGGQVDSPYGRSPPCSIAPLTPIMEHHTSLDGPRHHRGFWTSTSLSFLPPASPFPFRTICGTPPMGAPHTHGMRFVDIAKKKTGGRASTPSTSLMYSTPPMGAPHMLRETKKW